MSKRILFYALLAWALVTPISIAGTSLLYFPLLGLYGLLAFWTFKRWPPVWGWVEKAFISFWLISVLSAFFGVDPLHSRIRLGKDLYFLILVLLGAYLAQEPADSKLMRVVVISSVATAVFGIFQFAVGVNQSDNAGGIFWAMPPWLEHAPRALQNHLSMVNGRVVGTRAHPLTYAEGLLFPLAYTLSYLSTRRADWWKWALAQVIVLLALIVSQSRGPWIAAAVMGLVLCVLRRDVSLYKRLAVIYLPVALCFFSPHLRHRAQSMTNTVYDSNAERLEMWKAGRQMIQDHPLLGIGPGNMNRASPLYQPPKRKIEGPWGHLHNTYINVAAERGLLGLLSFLTFIMVLAGELWKGYQRSENLTDEEPRILILTALLSLVGWLVSGFTETVYHDSNVLMMFYFVMGIALATSRRLLKNL
jgi:O-antigen ligase